MATTAIGGYPQHSNLPASLAFAKGRAQEQNPGKDEAATPAAAPTPSDAGAARAGASGAEMTASAATIANWIQNGPSSSPVSARAAFNAYSKATRVQPGDDRSGRFEATGGLTSDQLQQLTRPPMTSISNSVFGALPA